jgi:hypothetical protein
MSPTEKNIAIYICLGLVLAAIFGGGYYFFSKTVLTPQEVARQKVENSTSQLISLKRRYAEERAIITKLQKEYAGVKSTILKRTDVLFSNPNSDNPRLKIKTGDPLAEENINNKRLEITRRLEAWEEKMEIINSQKNQNEPIPSLSQLVKSAEEDMHYIKEYIVELDVLIGGLSTDDSDLSQEQIDDYVSLVQSSSEQIDQSVNAVSDARSEMEEQEILAQSESYTEDSGSTGTTPQTNTTNSNTQSQTPSYTQPVVTQPQIDNQEKKVEQAKKEEEEVKTAATSGQSTTTAESTVDDTNVYYAPPQYYTPAYIYTDNSGWPDIAPSNNPDRPLLLDGSNKSKK